MSDERPTNRAGPAADRGSNSTATAATWRDPAGSSASDLDTTNGAFDTITTTTTWRNTTAASATRSVRTDTCVSTATWRNSTATSASTSASACGGPGGHWRSNLGGER